MGLGDLRPLIEARPRGELALRLFPDFPGDAPAGMIPAELLPAGRLIGDVRAKRVAGAAYALAGDRQAARGSR